MYIEEIGVNVYQKGTMGSSFVEVLSFSVETEKLKITDL